MAMTNKNTISTWKVVRHCVCSQVLQQQRQRQRLQKKYGYGTYTSRAYNILIPDKHPLCFCYLYFFSALSVAIASYHRILSLGSCITHHSPAIWPLRIRSTPQTHTHTWDDRKGKRDTQRKIKCWIWKQQKLRGQSQKKWHFCSCAGRGTASFLCLYTYSTMLLAGRK